MTPDHLKAIGVFVGSLALAFALSPIGNWFTRRSLEQWARDQRLRLLAFKTAPAWRGPRAWLRDENEEAHFVVVEDRAGLRRTGWVLFKWPWHGLGQKRIDVRWDEEPQDVELEP